jgi:glucose-1-phosphate cytidylyltransferase
MKTIILAGGLGTRLSEETKKLPKPMVKIGKYPIIFHIIKIYEYFRIKKFIIATGYKNKVIKNYFQNNHFKSEVICKFTGMKTNTGGRILRLKKIINNETFMVTYGDGVANINIEKLMKFHKKNKSIATMTIVRPPARWGYVKIKNNNVLKFEEKNQLNEGWINGGFFVFDPKIFDYIKKGDNTILETDVLPRLALKKKLKCFKHESFWQCMDNIRDKKYLGHLWKKKSPPWKLWS